MFEQGNEVVIPKDEAGFKAFKNDYETPASQFRSVTDTGLNPESSWSHLLYLIQRKTKIGGKSKISPDTRRVLSCF